MAREIINDIDAEVIAGGSICFTPDHTTCGRNCTDQYRVNDYDAAISYIGSHCKNMREKDILSNMVDLGYISPL